MGLRDTDDEEELFHDDCQPNRFTLTPYQQAQARLSTGVGGLGLPAAVVRRRCSASLGNLVSTPPSSGYSDTERPPGRILEGQDTGNRLGGADGGPILELHRNCRRSLKGVVSPSWAAWALGQPGENGRQQPAVTAVELAAHDG